MPVRRILIVDDDPQMRAMLALVVGLASIDATTAPDADAALAAVEAEVPDAVLIDVRLTGRDGFALAAELRARHPALRLILMSGDVTADAMGEQARIAAMHFLPKPFEPAALLSLLGGC